VAATVCIIRITLEEADTLMTEIYQALGAYTAESAVITPV
jgi:hypothetical protein